MKPNKLPRGSLVIYETKTGEPRYRAKWRDRDGRQCAPTIGPAWLVKEDGLWVPRPGRLQLGYFDQQAAYIRMAELIAERDREIELEASQPALSFDELAAAWLDYLSRGGRAKPSTLKDYRLLLVYPRSAIRGKLERKARIMERFAGCEAVAITTDEIAEFLNGLVIEGLSPRNVNKHRAVLHAIYAFGMKPGAFKLPTNPVAGTEKQRHGGEAAIDTFSAAELASIERVALDGEHRSQPDDFYGPGVFVEWRRLNQQDAAIIIVAAHTGLRQGELRALRWRHVDLEGQRVTVEAAISDGEVSTTKSRRIRTVPLTNTACRHLKGVASRSHFLEPEDLVFCGGAGGILDESALRRRFRRVQEKAGLRVRRFHDLRHTFGSVAVRRFDPVTVQSLMGHSSLSTTERYLHSRPRADDAAKLSEAFESDA
ncbi:MAG: site-specific integrase [Solirubrobacterales bacterium]|nr:site-specific integrase [Solirubrobacterales bacterium]